MFEIEYEEVAGWPALAWLARLREDAPTITVWHGSRVEVRPTWFCEAAWAGELEEGGFDLTDIVTGSGCRVREGEAVFVSATSLVDRLHSFRRGDTVWVSNSLVCLLTTLDASLDPTWPHFYAHLRTIFDGLARYERLLPTSAGPVELTYFDNLVWDGRNLQVRLKPAGRRRWPGFAEYRDFLFSSMSSMAANLAATGRRHPYTLLSTVSSGYDSSAVAAVASRYGCRDALCFTRARNGEEDSGEAVAAHLGMQPLVIESGKWRRLPLPEIPFIAGSARGSQVFFKGAEEHLAGRVLMTGFLGDNVWGSGGALGPDLRYGGTGMSLTEYRLIVGFLHCPMAYWGARDQHQVEAIKALPEMTPWEVPGPYSRPICRRIVEEAGVPRELFGTRKRNIAVLLNFHEFLTPASLGQYSAWLAENRTLWWRRGRIPPPLSPGFDEILRKARTALWWVGRKLDWSPLYRRMLRPSPLRRHVFPWAVEHMKSLYAPSLPASVRRLMEDPDQAPAPRRAHGFAGVEP